MCMASPNVRSEVEDHATYLRDVADITPPPLLPTLLKALEASGEEVVSPAERAGVIPLVIPLTRNESTGELTGILRWPTPPEGLEMPVVRVQKNGQLWLLAKTVEEFITMQLAEEDAAGGSALASALGDEGKRLYRTGDFAASKTPNVNVYLMKSVGKFPDVFERLAEQHLERKDEVSSLVTAEYYARKHFPGFGRAFVYNAILYKRLGRKQESRDAARIALKCPWWTLGASYAEVCELAGWGDEKLEFVKEKLTSEATQEDITKGKSPEQVALDQAAYMMDIAAAENNWDDVREQIAELYDRGGLPKLAHFFRAVGSS
ncbi:hypothetical protein KFL_001040140 [Klebsormidium nitens]|uniref:Cyclin delta-3 n=1 Tax=Klebsormidium nitens TaxID=105231 RepID=A0A1Y1HZ51_KLENI|nr:hypothetical protein KFL_001040140 [Klebsormidium nitens]|eukprot:GAQ82211.1 hypothetical protein KFL_001040140 [Klebsormidium nitens]